MNRCFFRIKYLCFLKVVYLRMIGNNFEREVRFRKFLIKILIKRRRLMSLIIEIFNSVICLNAVFGIVHIVQWIHFTFDNFKWIVIVLLGSLSSSESCCVLLLTSCIIFRFQSAILLFKCNLLNTFLTLRTLL